MLKSAIKRRKFIESTPKLGRTLKTPQTSSPTLFLSFLLHTSSVKRKGSASIRNKAHATHGLFLVIKPRWPKKEKFFLLCFFSSALCAWCNRVVNMISKVFAIIFLPIPVIGGRLKFPLSFCLRRLYRNHGFMLEVSAEKAGMRMTQLFPVTVRIKNTWQLETCKRVYVESIPKFLTKQVLVTCRCGRK